MTKTCVACQVVLPLSAFTKNARFDDGLSSQCRDCHRTYRISNGTQRPAGWERKTSDSAIYQREWRAANPEKIKSYEKNRPYDPVKSRAKYERKMKRLRGQDYVVGRTPGQLSAEDLALRRKVRTAYKTALKRGKLQRLPCMVCGETEADGHHPDYSKPLEVVSCHFIPFSYCCLIFSRFFGICQQLCHPGAKRSSMEVS